MQVNIPYPVHREDIRGRWQLVSGAAAPAICWGRDGRYWAWLHVLADDALMMVRQRVIVIALIAWLPLLLLSALQEQLWGGTNVPFLFDIEVHVRFLVALPLLFVAELVVHRRMRPLLQQFLERNMIPGNAMARFEAAVESAFRLRNSVLAEVLLIAVVSRGRHPDRMAPVHRT